jgi:hypothetical protein
MGSYVAFSPLAALQDQRNFLRDPPPGAQQFAFDFDASYPVALAILPYDDRLEEMRFALVPKKYRLLALAWPWLGGSSSSAPSTG